MPRRKILPDTDVHAIILGLLAAGGDKAVAFGSVSRATGLAPATLVQRFGNREAMVAAALTDAWDRLDDLAARAEAAAPTSAKGAGVFLKALSAGLSTAADPALLAILFRDPQLRDRAEIWRNRVVAALALRLGGGAKGQETAALLFSAWIGQAVWMPAGGKIFRIKDALKRLT